MKSTALVASALAAAIAMAGIAGAVEVADNEKCFGIAKAGKNDCKSSSGSCAGTANKDALPDTWIDVPAGTCEKIAGASLTPKA